MQLNNSTNTFQICIVSPYLNQTTINAGKEFSLNHPHPPLRLWSNHPHWGYWVSLQYLAPSHLMPGSGWLIRIMQVAAGWRVLVLPTRRESSDETELPSIQWKFEFEFEFCTDFKLKPDFILSFVCWWSCLSFDFHYSWVTSLLCAVCLQVLSSNLSPVLSTVHNVTMLNVHITRLSNNDVRICKSYPHEQNVQISDCSEWKASIFFRSNQIQCLKSLLW